MNLERTLIIAKHDAVQRGLTGEIIARFERVGLKLIGLEFIKATEDMGHQHYPTTKEWLEKVGNRCLTEYKEKGKDVKKDIGTDDPMEIGKIIKQWNVEYLTAGPVLALVFEGPGAIKIGRKLVGETNPSVALPGTIRGDFSSDNAEISNIFKRPFYNLVHASGSPEEAEFEIGLWFDKNEIHDKHEVHYHQAMGFKGKFKNK